MTKDTAPATTPRSRWMAPFSRTLEREMGEIFDRFRDFPALVPGGPMFPAVDLVESDGHIEITAEIPGVKEDDLDVSITRDVLTLKGEKSSEHKEDEEDFHMVERRYGSFRRQIPLGFTPKDDAVEAVFKDGVLKLKIAKPVEQEEPRRTIEISRG